MLIEAPCNGAGHCGKCAVRVAPDYLAHLTIPPGTHLPPEREAAGWLLACHAEVQGDVTVHVPTRSETGLQIITTGQHRRSVVLSPWITKRFYPETYQTLVYAGERLLTVERGDMADTGASVLSLDDEVDLAEAKIVVDDRVALLGNVRPTSVMVLGTTDDVRANVRECLVKAAGSPKGFILGMGCALPINTPPENIHALVTAAREYGRWPIDPERFAEQVKGSAW